VTAPTRGSCQHVDPETGKQCRGYPVADKQFCYFHEPSYAERRTLAQRIGGRRKAEKARQRKVDPDVLLPPEVYDEMIPEDQRIEVKSTDDLMPLMDRVLTLAFLGKANPPLINAITNAIKTSDHLLETRVFEDRLKELEEKYGMQR